LGDNPVQLGALRAVRPCAVRFGAPCAVRPCTVHFLTASVSERTFEAGVPSPTLGVRKISPATALSERLCPLTPPHGDFMGEQFSTRSDRLGRSEAARHPCHLERPSTPIPNAPRREGSHAPLRRSMRSHGRRGFLRLTGMMSTCDEELSWIDLKLFAYEPWRWGGVLAIWQFWHRGVCAARGPRVPLSIAMRTGDG